MNFQSTFACWRSKIFITRTCRLLGETKHSQVSEWYPFSLVVTSSLQATSCHSGLVNGKHGKREQIFPYFPSRGCAIGKFVYFFHSPRAIKPQSWRYRVGSKVSHPGCSELGADTRCLHCCWKRSCSALWASTKGKHTYLADDELEGVLLHIRCYLLSEVTVLCDLHISAIIF